jgi:hypothetical protein
MSPLPSVPFGGGGVAVPPVVKLQTGPAAIRGAAVLETICQ